MPATKPKKNMDDKLDDRTVFQKFISATKPSFASWFSTKTSYAAAGCKFRIEDDHGEVFVAFRGTANLEKLGMRGGWTKEKKQLRGVLLNPPWNQRSTWKGAIPKGN